jgi:hypothetical protein
LRFLNKTTPGLRVVRTFRGEKLEGDRPLELDVLGFIDDAHPAPADLFDNSVFSSNEAVFRYNAGECLERFR